MRPESAAHGGTHRGDEPLSRSTPCGTCRSAAEADRDERHGTESDHPGWKSLCAHAIDDHSPRSTAREDRHVEGCRQHRVRRIGVLARGLTHGRPQLRRRAHRTRGPTGRSRAARARWTAARRQETPIARLLHGSIDMQTDTSHPRGCLVALSGTVRAPGAGEAGARKVGAARRAADRARIRACVVRGITSGELAENADVDGATTMLHGFLLGISPQVCDGTSARHLHAAADVVLTNWDTQGR